MPKLDKTFIYENVSRRKHLEPGERYQTEIVSVMTTADRITTLFRVIEERKEGVNDDS
jgi:hypothetical protein